MNKTLISAAIVGLTLATPTNNQLFDLGGLIHSGLDSLKNATQSVNITDVINQSVQKVGQALDEGKQALENTNITGEATQIINNGVNILNNITDSLTTKEADNQFSLFGHHHNKDNTHTVDETNYVDQNGDDVKVVTTEDHGVDQGVGYTNVNTTVTVNNGTHGADIFFHAGEELFNNLTKKNEVPAAPADNQFFSFGGFFGHHNKKPQTQPTQPDTNVTAPTDPVVYHAGGYVDVTTQPDTNTTETNGSADYVNQDGEDVHVTVNTGTYTYDGTNVTSTNVTVTVGNGTKGADILFGKLAGELPLGPKAGDASDNQMFKIRSLFGKHNRRNGSQTVNATQPIYHYGGYVDTITQPSNTTVNTTQPTITINIPTISNTTTQPIYHIGGFVDTMTQLLNNNSQAVNVTTVKSGSFVYNGANVDIDNDILKNITQLLEGDSDETSDTSDSSDDKLFLSF